MAAFTPPSVNDFFKRFPAFAGTDAHVVEALLAECPVDDSWLAKDFTPATLYWVAHMMTAESGDLVDRAGAIVSESFGPMSRQYAQTQGVIASIAQLGSTEYGRRFLELRNRNFPGPLVC